MSRWLVALAAILLPLAALAGLTSRDSTYNNACAIQGTCTGGGGTASPIMFQHVSTETNPAGIGITGRGPIFNTEPLPANSTIVIAVTVLHGKAVTISDTLIGSWGAAVCSADAGTGLYITYVFVQPMGATGGIDTVTVAMGSSNFQPFAYTYTIFENIATSSPANGSLCTANINATSGGVISPGSFTPTTNNNANGGNVIWNAVAVCGSAGSNSSNWTPASGFSLLHGDIIWTSNQGYPNAAQFETQATQASVTPSITATGENTTGDCFNSVSVAMKVANNSSTAPTTIHVAKIIHESYASWSTPSTLKVQIPFTGNLRVITTTYGQSMPNNTATLSSVTSSDGCNFTPTAPTSVAYIWYAQNCSPCLNCTVTFTPSGTSTQSGASFRVYDIQNALASSFQNSSGTTGGTIACGTVMTGILSLTPSGASSGLAIVALGNGNGPFTGNTSATAITSPSGPVFDLWFWTAGLTDSDVGDNSDLSAHYYYSSTAAQTWSFAKLHGSDSCYGTVAAFN
jgi:hypothetical protein